MTASQAWRNPHERQRRPDCAGKLPYALAERSDRRLTHFGVRHELRGYDADHELTPAMAADFGAWLATVLAE